MFIFFRVACITYFPCNKQRKTKHTFYENVMSTINVFLIFSTAAFLIYTQMLESERNSAIFVSIVLTVCLIFRCFLCKEYSRLLYLSNTLCTFVRSSMFITLQKKFYLKIMCLAILSFLMNIVSLFLSLFTNNEKRNLSVENPIHLGYNNTQYRIHHALYDFFTITSFYTISIPIIIFYLFYVAVCFHIYMMVEEQRQFMHSELNPRFNLLLKYFLSARKLLVTADNILYRLISFVIFIVSANLYSVFKMNFDDVEFIGFFYQIYMYITVLNCLVIFFGVCFAASDVANKISETGEKAKSLLQYSQKSDVTQILFIMNTDYKLTMTVIGGIPINSKFILVYFGTAITYLALEKSLNIM